MTVTAYAPGKIILFGEHAVVYGQPALAIPINSIRAEARISEGDKGTGLVIDAVDLNVRYALASTASEGLAVVSRLVLEHINRPEPDAVLAIRSTIPVASGLGSGAAVAAAAGRALAEYLGYNLGDAELSALVYEVEKLHHGTPSGIDNTVVCYNQPVYFTRNQPIETFEAATPFHLVIGDTGIPSPTRITVGAVRAAWEQDRERYEQHFADIGAIAQSARQAIEQGNVPALGPLMRTNQTLLEQIGVSSPELARLIAAAIDAGAAGAKLSGGGGGGNMIALVTEEQIKSVSHALTEAGAVRVISTTVQ